MAKRTRILVGLAVVVAGLLWLRYHSVEAPEVGNSGNPARGGRLAAILRTEPTNFNRYVKGDSATDLISQLTQATLVRLNRVTGVLEPRLARDWTSSPDGTQWTLNLRTGVLFSDGVPFTAADVTFSFDMLYDKRVASPIASAMQVAGRPLSARAIDDHTVVVTFPAPPGPGLAMLDALPILPRHSLAPALAAGTLSKTWLATTPPSEIVGLGPFVVSEYHSGERLSLSRNPHFWGRDTRGEPLPYLDGIDFQIVPEQSAELLRFESGDVDLMTDTDQVRPQDMSSLKQAETKGLVRLAAVGVSPDANLLWFDLAPNAPRAKDRPWLQREELRRAISCAADRQAIVDSAYLGEAVPVFGPVTPGDGDWYLPELGQSTCGPAQAKTLLASIGLVDRHGDGMLEDAAGRPARFAIITHKGNSVREDTVAMLQDQLKKVGLGVDVVALDPGAVVAQFAKGDYDAIFFGFQTDSTDPARNLDYWLSSGAYHIWDPDQASPATPWEARIDVLMKQQETTLDAAARRKLFADVQRIFAEHLPAIYFAAPKVTVAIGRRVVGATPALLKPHVLWNAEALRLAASDHR